MPRRTAIGLTALGLLSLFLACPQTLQADEFTVGSSGADTAWAPPYNLTGQNVTVAIVDSVQIDGTGAKEIILLRKGTGFTNEHGGTFDISESKNIQKYEIWNPDTKTILFEAISIWSYDYDIFRAGQSLNPLLAKQGKGSEKYKYDLTVNSAGDVIIDNLCGLKDTKPDHAIGIYQFRNGKYTLKTDEPAKN